MTEEIACPYCGNCKYYKEDESGKQFIFTGYCDKLETYTDFTDAACEEYEEK